MYTPRTVLLPVVAEVFVMVDVNDVELWETKNGKLDTTESAYNENAVTWSISILRLFEGDPFETKS